MYKITIGTINTKPIGLIRARGMQEIKTKKNFSRVLSVNIRIDIIAANCKDSKPSAIIFANEYPAK
jgi:hypothetical protein